MSAVTAIVRHGGAFSVRKTAVNWQLQCRKGPCTSVLLGNPTNAAKFETKISDTYKWQIVYENILDIGERTKRRPRETLWWLSLQYSYFRPGQKCCTFAASYFIVTGPVQWQNT